VTYYDGQTISRILPSDISEAEIQAIIDRDRAQVEAWLAQQTASRTGQDTTTTTTGSQLTRPMEAMAVGDPVPVVFARRRTGGTGGVMVQPRATEIQVGNTSTTLTVRWHCLLGDGPMGSVQTRDVRNGLSRQGAFSQNYDRRAGSWLPGSRVVAIPGQELPALPLQTGGGGNYRGVSTIEFGNTYPIDSQRWSQAWNVFIRGGLVIERGRLVDDVVGHSDNLCDLVIWALTHSGMASLDQIDLAAMEQTAGFLEANGLFCNAEFADAASIPDWLAGILPAFLLRETTIGGRFALVPALPVNADGTLNADPLEPDLTITEEILAPGGFSEQPAPAATRGPLRIVTTYRQQTSDSEPPLECSLAVGSEADALPAQESFPLAGFCTSRLHAATAGAYRHALRTLAGGTATAALRPGSQTGTVAPGQVARVLLRIEAEQETGWISSWWQVVRVDLDGDGNETLQLTELPVDAEGRSIITQQVLAARALAGDVEFPYPAISEEDEPGRSSDTSVPASSTSGTPFVDGDRGGGDVNLPPAPPPADPPGPGNDISGGEGSAVATGGQDSRDRDKRQPGRTRSLPWVCQNNQILYVRTKITQLIDGVPSENEKHEAFSAGEVNIVLTQTIVQNTIYAPTPMTRKTYEIRYQPIIVTPGQPDTVGNYATQTFVNIFIGGPTYGGEMWGDIVVIPTLTYCTNPPVAY
jgi:hypothetical protein